MKNIFSIITFPVLFILLLSACEEENDLRFTAVPSEDGISFTNTLSAYYPLSEDTEANLAERFVWSIADFDAPTNVNYDLQASLSSSFTSFDLIGTTTATNLSVTVGQLLAYAEKLDLDDDPTTTNDDGSPNNTGVVHFRVRAYAGSGTGNNTEILSDIISLNLEVIEQVATGECEGLFALGDALVDAQWNWNTAINIPCETNVLTTKINLTNGTLRLFEIEFDWTSGFSYPYLVDKGYTIDANFEDAMDGDNNFRFVGTPGIYEMVIDRNAKTITLEESSPLWILGDATPDVWNWGTATVATENTINIWSATLAFNTGTFRFFTVQDDWGSGLNYTYYINEGFTIDANFEDAMDGDNNFRFIGTPGTYTITINAIDKTILTVPENVYPSSDIIITSHTEWTRTHYPTRIEEFKANPLREGDIVFLGNSITEQGGDWSARINKSNARNRGIAGDTSEGVLARLGELIYYKPSKLFILIGINDLFNDNISAENVFDNIKKIVEEVNNENPNTEIYVNTVLPTNSDELITKIENLNNLLENAESSSPYKLIKAHSLFVLPDGKMDMEFSTDGVHLNENGYQLWVDKLKEFL